MWAVELDTQLRQSKATSHLEGAVQRGEIRRFKTRQRGVGWYKCEECIFDPQANSVCTKRSPRGPTVSEYDQLVTRALHDYVDGGRLADILYKLNGV